LRGPTTPEEQLRDAILRVTGTRVAVLTEVHANPHSDVDTLTANGAVATWVGFDAGRGA